MGDYSIYPDAIDGYSQLPLAVDNVTRVDAVSINRLRDAILCIERELGINPSSDAYETVAARLDAIEELIDNFEGGGLDDGDLGDIVVSGEGTVLTIDAGVVDNTKLADMANSTIKGRVSIGTGEPEDLTAAQVKSLLSITGSDISDITEVAQDAVGAMVNASLTYVDGTPLLSIADRDFGDITTTVSGTVWTIDSNAVANTKLNDMAQATIKGRQAAAGTGDPEDLTAAQVKTILSLTSTDISDFTEAAQDATGAMVNASLTYTDGTPLLSIADRDFGDITTSSNGTVWTLDSAVQLTTTMFAQTLALAAVMVGGLLIGGTTEKYEILLAATPTTEATVVSSWDDITSTGFTSGTTTNVTNGASAVSIAGSPASSTKRLIKEVSVFNRAYLPIVATIRFFDGTNNRTVGVWRLGPEDVLLYSPRIGWHVTNKGVAVRRAGAVDDAPALMVPVHGFPAILASSNKTHVSGDTVAVYLGEAEADFTQVKLRWATGATAAATITWAEIAVAYGDADLGSNPTLYLLGYTNIAAEVAVINSTYHSTIRASGHAGMKLWALLGMAATTLLVQVGSSADNLSSGVCATATVRPSAIPAAGTSFTVDGTNAIPRYMWEIA